MTQQFPLTRVFPRNIPRTNVVICTQANSALHSPAQRRVIDITSFWKTVQRNYNSYVHAIIICTLCADVINSRSLATRCRMTVHNDAPASVQLVSCYNIVDLFNHETLWVCIISCLWRGAIARCPVAQFCLSVCPPHSSLSCTVAKRLNVSRNFFWRL